jgi:hypothetical protein
MGGHSVVTRNGPADLSTEKVQNGAARRVFDDELDQLHGVLREASGGFNEEDGQVLGVVHEVPENRPVVGALRVGADVVDLSVAGVGGRPETAARVESFGRIVGGSGGIADSHVDESPVGGGDEAGVRADPSGVAGMGAAGAELGDGLPGANVDGGVVAGGFVAEVGDASGVARGKNEGLMRKDREDGGVVGRN